MAGRFEGADGIRGLACLIVIFIHASAFFFASTREVLAGTGKIGVWLFFVLSSFLLTNKFMRSGFNVSSVASYAVGRFLRIIPLFYFVAFLYYYKGGFGIATIEDLISCLTFEKGYGHLWTIPVEFKFYVILPFMAYLFIGVFSRFGIIATIIGCVIVIALQQSIWPFWDTPENSIDTRWYLSSFTIGSFIAVAHHHLRNKLDGRLADICGLFVIVLVVLSFPYLRYLILDMPIDKWLMNKFLWFSILWGLFILVLAEGKGRLGGMLRHIVLRKIGEWSYSIYLIHIMVYALVAAGRSTSFPLMLTGIIGSIGAGAFLYYCFERPMEHLRHRIQVLVFKS